MKGITIKEIREACLKMGLQAGPTQALIDEIIERGADRAKREAFGKFIRERRKALDLEQGDVAARMGDIITPSHISNMETGKSFIGFDKLWPLAQALECEAWEIVATTEEAMKPYLDLHTEDKPKEDDDAT